MGYSFWILVYSNYGCGLDLVEPRMLTDEKGRNSFSGNTRKEMAQKALMLLEKNDISDGRFMVIHSLDNTVYRYKMELQILRDPGEINHPTNKGE